MPETQPKIENSGEDDATRWRRVAETYEQRYREMAERVDRLETQWSEARAEGYRAGREDLLRAGSCPECEAGEAHPDPTEPHVHLTAYGYLLYAPGHERPGFIEELRAVERRVGREDAARQAQDQADFWFKVAVNTAMRAGIHCPRCMHLITTHWPDDERQKPGCHARERASKSPCLCSYSPEEVLLYTAGPMQEHGRDGVDGYLSPRCMTGLAGCDDKACVCRCHDEADRPRSEIEVCQSDG